MLGLTTTSIAEKVSWGERLLPLFIAAMETCWISAVLILLAETGLFQTSQPLMPLWIPFLLIAGSHWFATYVERREVIHARNTHNQVSGTETSAPGSTVFILLVMLATLFIIWLSVYSSTIFLLDPRWLLAIVNDILLFTQTAYHIYALILMVGLLCWRGIRLARREIEPFRIFQELLVGTGIIVLVILIRTALPGRSVQNELLLLLLIPFFLFFGLSAHALARIAFIRQTHPVGLEGNIADQERAVISVIAIIGLILLALAFMINALISPAFLANIFQTPIFKFLGTALDWLANALAWLIVILVTPVFWLLSLLHIRAQPPKVPPPNEPNQPGQAHQPPPSPAYMVFILVLKILIPVLLLVALILLLRWALRRRRVLLASTRPDRDIHESLWSWQLFWQQLRAFFRGLFSRPRPVETPAQTPPALIEGTPAVRSVREIYRALLQWSARRGVARKKDETPSEFQQRLNSHVPAITPQLGTLTETYIATRYGEIEPGESELIQVRTAWTEIERQP